ncbi:hypothetical protein RIF29_19877 [Crotalaria pallida]|uniref:Uncharacterized protein n=1 Tax=Crotalaria pallida TaxID=3830 RepID=A0AAN9F069_CROPI
MQSPSENQGGDSVEKRQVVINNEGDSEEALHGDWLVVRRRKKWGTDKRKGLVSEKNKEKLFQSLPTESSSQRVLHAHDKVEMGSPHLLAFPTSASIGNRSRGTSYSNEKKRARRDSQHVANQEVGGNRIPKAKDTTMHKPTAKDVRLNGESKPSGTNSVSQLGNTKNFSGIVISPNLLLGSTLGNKGKEVKGRPPDPSRKLGAVVSKLDDIHLEGGRKDGTVVHTVDDASGMLLDSRQ